MSADLSKPIEDLELRKMVKRPREEIDEQVSNDVKGKYAYFHKIPAIYLKRDIWFLIFMKI